MPYFEFDIENAQCLYLDTDGGTDIRVSIDGEKETLYTGCVGMVNIGNDKINTKKHTVRVYCGDEKNVFTLKGVYSDCCSVISKTKSGKTSVQFIGDCVTESGFYDYPTIVSKALGYNFSVIARSGIALEDGSGFVKLNDGENGTIGMQTSYGYLRTIGARNLKEKYDAAVEWNFENDKHDKIFVNLGANDTYSAFVDEAKTKKFIESYKNFVNMLKSKHKNAAIYIIKPFSPISKQGEMHILNRSAAFDKIADEFKNDKTVRYIDTDEWSGEITFLSGSIFPDRNGHEIIAGKLTEYLQTN